MTPKELQKLVTETWDNSTPKGRLIQLANISKFLSAEELETFDAIVDARLSAVQDDPQSTTVILIHGIRTDARWHEIVKKEFRGLNNVNVVSVGYGFFSVLRFLGPFRGYPIKTVAEELHDIRQQEPISKFVIVAHSFGTYIVSKILQKHAGLVFERILFCGSVVKTSYPWSRLSCNLNSKKVVNDIGTQDIWPIFAKVSTLGYGCSGRLGFKRNRVTDRYFDCGHDGFFTSKHIRKFWIPFVESGTIVESDWNQKKPVASYILLFSSSVLSIPLFVLLILVSVVFLYFDWIIRYLFA